MSRHLPPNIPIDIIKQIYRSELCIKTDELVEKIHEFIQIPLENNVDSAELQVFPDEQCEGESSICIYFDGKDKKIDRNDPKLFAGQSLELYSSFNELPTLDLEAYEELDFSTMLVDLIIQWCAECWWKAGGWYYPVSVDISGHDGYASIDRIALTKI